MAIAQESSTPPDIDPDPRAELIDGLRELADFYEQHPDFTLPYLEGIGGLLMVNEWYDADRFAELASMLGGKRTKHADESYFNITRHFGPLRVELGTHREIVCEKVETGRTRTVTVESLPNDVEAQIAALRSEHAVTETVEEPEVEWRCLPILERTNGVAHVAALRDAAAEARAEVL